jgi:hypothetical protein
MIKLDHNRKQNHYLITCLLLTIGLLSLSVILFSSVNAFDPNVTILDLQMDNASSRHIDGWFINNAEKVIDKFSLDR